MYEALDGAELLGALKQDVRAHDVVVREGEAVAERVVDVRLRRKMYDGVYLLLPQDVRDEVAGADVALDKLTSRGRGRKERLVCLSTADA